MTNSSPFYPRPVVTSGSVWAVGQAGGVLLTETIRAAGLDVGLRTGLGRWRRSGAVHDPAKVVLDLAVAQALGSDCLADVAVLRAEPGLFGAAASDPTVSRTITALAADAPAVLEAIDTARAAARAQVSKWAGAHAPDHDASAVAPLIVDLDATLVTAHSEKKAAAPTFKRGFGFHPLCAFVDHGAAGTGEMIAVQLRPGNAGSNTAVDHIVVTRAALAQLPGHQAGRRPGRRVLIRTDGAGSSHAFLDWLSAQRLSHSVGFALPTNTGELLALMDKSVWTPPYSSAGGIREGSWVAELTGMLNLTGWPKGMRVIVRKERPYPGAQLRITDADGLRVTALATNTARGHLPDLELRHRRRARAEDRIRCAKDTGLRNLPLHGLNQNRIWCAIVTLAAEITAWMQLLALSGSNARRWEPKRLRLRLFTIAAALTRHSRQVVLNLNRKQPWATLALHAITALRAAHAAPG